MKRRQHLLSIALAAGAFVAATMIAPATAQAPKLKVGFMLPYTGTYAALGNAIENGFRLYVAGAGRQARRPRDRVLQGRRRVRAVEGDRQRQQAHQARQRRRHRRHRALGRRAGDGEGREGQQHAADRAERRRRRDHRADVRAEHLPQLVLELAAGLRDGRGRRRSAARRRRSRSPGSTRPATSRRTASRRRSRRAAARSSRTLNLPFPNVEFQALLTEIAATKPDAVYAFFAGGGAVKFVKDYAAAGLNKTIPLYGPGFLTDGTLEAQGDAAQGMLTTLHYADGLDTPRDNAFRLAYAKAYKLQPDVYAVQGYDAAQMLAIGLKAVGGDVSKKRRVRGGDREGEDRQPARHVHAISRRTTRCRTSTCARSTARRTVSTASR